MAGTSRIGKLPIPLKKDVQVSVLEDNTVIVKGKLGELSQNIHKDVKVDVSETEVVLSKSVDTQEVNARFGLGRALIANMINGVSEGYEIRMELVGVGYKATSIGQLLEVHLGFSHSIVFQLPEEIKVVCETEKRANSIIILKGIDKQLIGHVAAKIRSFRKPEPYKGKGVKFVNEILRRKAGKLAASAK